MTSTNADRQWVNNGTSGKVSSFFSFDCSHNLHGDVRDNCCWFFLLRKIAAKINDDLGETHETKILKFFYLI